MFHDIHKQELVAILYMQFVELSAALRKNLDLLYMMIIEKKKRHQGNCRPYYYVCAHYHVMSHASPQKIFVF